MSIPTAEDKPSLQPETQPFQISKSKPRRIWWILGGILFVLLLTAAGAWMGYEKAIQMRVNKQSEQVALEATTQFQLGVQDMAEKRFDMARQRFEYVIRLDPTFPGAQEKLTEVMFLSSITETPTPAPTPTPIPVTPTPDLRGVEELFTQAVQFINAEEWTQAIDTLDNLRKQNVGYRAVEVDGKYYIALRNRGAERILQEGKLQEGLYDLALAERFGPLDADANGYRVWANLYLTGASYWKVDWAQAAYYFGQIYPYYPGLRDTSGLTSTERYRQAVIGMADQTASGDSCEAEKLYREALQFGPDPKVDEKLNQAANACAAANATPTPEASPTPSATPEGALPTATPGEAVPTETIAPVENPTPTETPTVAPEVVETTPTVT